MAITILIRYTGAIGNARRFAQDMTSGGIVDAIRLADGNEGYEYFLPMTDENSVLLIDKWRDQAALDSHHASAMMAQISELRNRYDLHMTVERYEASESVPKTDETYIRK